MKLILDTLEAARLTASPSDALGLADALADLSDLADVLALLGMALDDVLPVLAERRALRDHVASQPFDAYESFDGSSTVKDLTPGAFIDWLETLERLAQ
jgi:hypothetical protein